MTAAYYATNRRTARQPAKRKRGVDAEEPDDVFDPDDSTHQLSMTMDYVQPRSTIEGAAVVEPSVWSPAPEKRAATMRLLAKRALATRQSTGTPRAASMACLFTKAALADPWVALGCLSMSGRNLVRARGCRACVRLAASPFSRPCGAYPLALHAGTQLRW
jgi:hypothetical protein